jgi:hypothetical protein
MHSTELQLKSGIDHPRKPSEQAHQETYALKSKNSGTKNRKYYTVYSTYDGIGSEWRLWIKLLPVVSRKS